MTGFEYTAGVGMIYEGRIENGLKVGDETTDEQLNYANQKCFGN